MTVFPEWQELGRCAPTALRDARLTLHWAAQLVSAVGTTLLAPAADDTHTNLEWLAGPAVLAGQLTVAAPRCRAALRPGNLTVCVLDEDGKVASERWLDGLTFSQGMVWLEQEIAAFTQRPLSKPLKRRALELPDHPVAHGRAFAISDPSAFAELGHWYANADAVLRAMRGRFPEASPVRCWPHHFDIATLLTLPAGTGDALRTIGIGLSPGDSSYDEPYWYVTPWPSPAASELPPLRDGEWHRSGWCGAVLTGSMLTSGASDSQACRVFTFLRSAADICRGLLEQPPETPSRTKETADEAG